MSQNPELVAVVKSNYEIQQLTGCDMFYIYEGHMMVIKDILGKEYFYDRIYPIHSLDFLNHVKMVVHNKYNDPELDRLFLIRCLNEGKYIRLSSVGRIIVDSKITTVDEKALSYLPIITLKDTDVIVKKLEEMRIEYEKTQAFKEAERRRKAEERKAEILRKAEKRKQKEEIKRRRERRREAKKEIKRIQQLSEKIYGVSKVNDEYTLKKLEKIVRGEKKKEEQKVWILYRESHTKSCYWSPKPLDADYTATPKRRGRKIRKCSFKNPDLVNAAIQSEDGFYDKKPIYHEPIRRINYYFRNSLIENYFYTASDLNLSNINKIYTPNPKYNFSYDYNPIYQRCYFMRDLEETDTGTEYIRKMNGYLQTIIYEPLVSKYEKYVTVPIAIISSNYINKPGFSCIKRKEDKDEYIRKNADLLEKAAYLILSKYTKLIPLHYNLEHISIDSNYVMMFKFKRKFNFTLIEDDD